MRMRFVPTIVPKPSQMIDLMGISGLHLHLRCSATQEIGIP
jgi:hypothetical protein